MPPLRCHSLNDPPRIAYSYSPLSRVLRIKPIRNQLEAGERWQAGGVLNLDGAHFQGRYVAETTTALVHGRRAAFP